VIQGLAAIRRGEAKILELGNLDARVDWGYAPDYTRAMQRILDAGEPTEYVVASGETHSVREFVEVAADHLGLRWRDCVVETEGLVQRAPQALCGDASRLRSVTGWSPTLNFQAMVRGLVDAAMAQDARKA
jgi:GDPmannose 4,6-dehydratase